MNVLIVRERNPIAVPIQPHFEDYLAVGQTFPPEFSPVQMGGLSRDAGEEEQKGRECLSETSREFFHAH